MNHITLKRRTESPARKIDLRFRGHPVVLWLRENAQPRGVAILAQCGAVGEGEVDTLAENLFQEAWTVGYVDLVSESECQDPFVTLDVPLLGRRLAAAVDLSRANRAMGGLPIAITSWGNAAAAGMWLAAESEQIAAVVSISGSPHLAEPRLGQVGCPTLLLVPSGEERLLHVNRMAAQRLGSRSRLKTLSHSKGTEMPFVREAAVWLASTFGAPPRKTAPRASRSLQTFLLSRYLKSLIGPLVAFFSGIFPKA